MSKGVVEIGKINRMVVGSGCR